MLAVYALIIFESLAVIIGGCGLYKWWKAPASSKNPQFKAQFKDPRWTVLEAPARIILSSCEDPPKFWRSLKAHARRILSSSKDPQFWTSLCSYLVGISGIIFGFLTLL